MIFFDMIIATVISLAIEIAGLLAVMALVLLLAVLADWIDWPRPR